MLVTLTFTLTVDTSALSVHGAANQTAFTTQASGCQVGVACTTQPVVTIQDAGGRTVTTGSDSVLPMSLVKHSGTGSITVTSPVVAVAGVAAFMDLLVSATTTNLKVTASATFTGAVSPTTLNSSSNIPCQRQSCG